MTEGNENRSFLRRVWDGATVSVNEARSTFTENPGMGTFLCGLSGLVTSTLGANHLPYPNGPIGFVVAGAAIGVSVLAIHVGNTTMQVVGPVKAEPLAHKPREPSL